VDKKGEGAAELNEPKLPLRCDANQKYDYIGRN